jgi:hypothetical protein
VAWTTTLFSIQFKNQEKIVFPPRPSHTHLRANRQFYSSSSSRLVIVYSIEKMHTAELFDGKPQTFFLSSLFLRHLKDSAKWKNNPLLQSIVSNDDTAHTGNKTGHLSSQANASIKPK